jgi:hypothetical protein
MTWVPCWLNVEQSTCCSLHGAIIQLLPEAHFTEVIKAAALATPALLLLIHIKLGATTTVFYM